MTNQQTAAMTRHNVKMSETKKGAGESFSFEMSRNILGRWKFRYPGKFDSGYYRSYDSCINGIITAAICFNVAVSEIWQGPFKVYSFNQCKPTANNE
jgi:hypothetical protein